MSLLFSLENPPVAVIAFCETIIRPVYVEALVEVDAVGRSVAFADCAGEVPGLFWAREVVVEPRADGELVLYLASFPSFGANGVPLFCTIVAFLFWAWGDRAWQGIEGKLFVRTLCGCTQAVSNSNQAPHHP